MFPNLGGGVAGIWLCALLALWAALLVGGLIFGAKKATPERRMPTWTRLASSLTLVLAAWSWLALTRGGSSVACSALLALGMTLGCVGDLALARLLPLREPVLTGIPSFGLGHGAYIVALLACGGLHGLAAPWSGFAALLAWLAWLSIGLVGWYVVVAHGHRRTTLHWVALPYALLLASTAGVATGLTLQAEAFIFVALGGALFLASDLILAGQLFSGLTFPLIGDVIWLTYGPAQALIVYGGNAAFAALSGRQ
jgi:hypothetical protein